MINFEEGIRHRDDQNVIVSRRRVPQVYVMDATGDVLLRGVAEESLSPRTRGLVTKLIAEHPDDDVVVGLAESSELIRLVRLTGKGRPCYALFIESVATRSPVEAAGERFALSERERGVLPFLLRGAATIEIANELMIAESTVATHIRNIGAKMNATKRKEIVAAVLGGR